MKRVLVLNADSFVGIHVCRRFFEAKEYLIDGTLYHQAETPRAEIIHENTLVDGPFAAASDDVAEASPAAARPLEPTVPLAMEPFLHSVMPRHTEISDEVFRARLLTYDILIAVLEEDAFEAECAIRVLRGSHYEVEKTFVLVSNVLTWAQTDEHEHELRLAERRAEREASHSYDDSESVASLPEEEEEMERKVWSEEEYRRRCPDARYHVWKKLEHSVKHANSETLHTYVLWAGLPYGDGEDLLAPYFRAAWRHQKLLQYGDGSNYIPTIHIMDLSRIIYLVGSSYDTLEDRYMFAVDQGNNTQAEILQGIRDFIGGELEITERATHPDELGRMDRLHAELETMLLSDVIMCEQKDEMLTSAGALQPEMALENANAALRDGGDEYPHAAVVVAPEKTEPTRGVGEGGVMPLTTATVDEGLQVDLPHGLANWFSAVNMRCEPGAVLSILDDSQWVSLGGFFANVDKVVREYKAERLLHPMRIVLSGPPFSMTGEVASGLSELLRIPHLTVENVIAAYEVHTASVRAELVEILLRRWARRDAAREERRLRREERVKKARAEERRRRREEEREGEEEEEEESEEGDEEKRSGVADGDEGDGEEEEEEEEDDEEGNRKKKKKKSVVAKRSSEYYTDVILLHTSDGGEEEEDEDEEEEDEDEEEEDEKAAALAQKLDEEEHRRIATLREEYRFATKVLALRLVNGEFPPRPASKGDSDEEEEDDDGDYNTNEDRGDDDDDDDDDEEEEEESDEEGDGRRGRQLGNTEETSPDSGGGGGDEEAKEAMPPPPVIRYMDEALAVMVRWRLRQDDCKNQGYILECFPESVRQARLTFLADTEEQKEMQSPKLQRDREGDVAPQLPYDSDFPLPNLDTLDEQQQVELLDAMMGRTFPSAEEALSPTHDAFFPDCFILLSSSETTLQAHMTAAHTAEGDDDTARKFYEQLSQFMRHNRPNAPPTESLPTWFQTVTAEMPNDVDDGTTDGGAQGSGSGSKVSRSVSVLRMLAFPSITGAAHGSSQLDGACSEIDAYCRDIRLKILDNIGQTTCGEVINAMRAGEEDFKAEFQELVREEARLEQLSKVEAACVDGERVTEAACIEEEHRVLRYYQAREVLGEVAEIEGMPTDMYLMRYVLPSLTPLMAEVVRLRPDDPVTVLADALFHHKRQTVL